MATTGAKSKAVELPVAQAPQILSDATLPKKIVWLCSVPVVRAIFWTAAILFAAAQTWGARHAILSDGISYIEIAQAYLRHDWANAVNAYWSPLYSWLIAAAFLVLHPNPYWEVATAHLVLGLTFFVGLFFFEYFLRELNLFLKDDRGGGASPVSTGVLYIAGYSAFLFGGLALVGVGYCSPDMIAYALMFFLSGAILRASRTGGSDLLFIAIGAACALFYLARTAFAPSILVFLLIVLGLRWKQGLGLIRPTALIVLPCVALSAPFVFAISHKTGTLTIGESGRLNYGWEVDGASRLIHWQGEPFDIGTPSHPTQKAVAAPETFVFPGPVAGMYPPWYDPSYWYAGIRPKFKLGQELRILFVNVTVAANYFVRSPIVVPVCLLILVMGPILWVSHFVRLWPVWVPALFGVGLYCLVYFEKRYIAANFVIVWITLLASIRITKTKYRFLAQALLVGFALVFTFFFFARKQVYPIKVALRDLLSRHEHEWSADYVLAQRLTALGLRPGDKIAFIGSSINAYWAHLAGVRIVAEVPLLYGRTERPLNNALINDTRQIQAFWEAGPESKDKVLRAFRDAGAVMAVADGYFCSSLASQWARVLPESQEHIPRFDEHDYSHINSRYYPLRPLTRQ